MWTSNGERRGARRRARVPAISAALLAAGSLAATAHGFVDVLLGPKAAIKGSISPTGDSDSFRFSASPGSVLTVVVKAKGKKSSLDPSLEIVPEGGGPALDLSAAAKFVDQGRKVVVKRLPIAQAGTYVLTVAGTGIGEYRLKSKVAPQKSYAETRALDDVGTATTVEIPVPDGARVDVTARAPNGSEVVPEFVFDGPLKATSVKMRFDDVVGPGLLTVRVRNANGVAGDVDVTARIKPVRVPKTKADVRGAALNRPNGGETAVSQAVGAAAGGSVVVPEGPLGGAGIEIPPGAMAEDTVITVQSVPDIDVPDPGQNAPAGPTVDFGPDGLEFGEDAEVTLPYDPASIPEGEEPEDVLMVVQEEADGSQQVLPPSGVDPDEETVTVAVGGFSRFRAFAERGTPRVEGNEYWLAVHNLEFLPDPDGLGTSVSRGSGLLYGTFEFRGSTTASVAGDATRVLSHAANAAGAISAVTNPVAPRGADTWTRIDDNTVRLSGGELLTQSDDGRFIVSSLDDGLAGGRRSLALLLRKPRRPPTLADVAGEYWVGVFGIDAETSPPPFGVDAPPAPLDVELRRAFGTLRVRPDGTSDVNLTSTIQEFVDGTFDEFAEADVAETDLRIDDLDPVLAGSAIFADEGGDQLRLFPVAGFDAMVGVPLGSPAEFEFVVCVRKSTTAKQEDLAAEYRHVGLVTGSLETFEINAQLVPPRLVAIPDFNVEAIEETVEIDPDGLAGVTDPFFEVAIFRDPLAVPDGFTVDVGTPDFETVTVLLDKNGRLNPPVPGLLGEGALTPDGSFAFLVGDGDDQGAPFGFDIFVRTGPYTPALVEVKSSAPGR